MRPFFWATKTRLGVNATAVGWVRPLQTVSSLKPAGRIGPAAATGAAVIGNDRRSSASVATTLR
jgi:hypothetical protein